MQMLNLTASRSLTLAAATVLAFAVAAPAAAAGVKTLVLGHENDVSLDAAVLADLTGSDARFDHVNSSAYDATAAGLPTLAYLSQFDSVLVSTNLGPNGTALSNLLGSYVNGGGRVVISTFFGQEAGTAGGLLNSSGYNPLINPTFDAYNSQTLGAFDASSPLFANVFALSSILYNADYLAGLDTGATLVGSWASGRPLEAINAAGNVIAITLYPNVVQYGHATGDYRALFANALAFGGGGAVPEASTWAMLIAGFGLVGASMRRRKAVAA